MLESFNVKNEMQYQRLTAEEQQQRGILGRLVGVIADFKNPTRNGRRYTEELWDKTFNDPIMKEKIDNRCVFGELGHPADRTEIDMEKIAISLAEVPKKGNDGKLYGVFDILNTPNGRILKTMCDYGCNIGVSSRGNGDTFEDYDGKETVDPDTYECECWDAVLLPAVKSARPQYVTESFRHIQSTPRLKTALREALEKASDEDKKVMKQTLNELQLDVEANDVENDNPPEKVDNINEAAQTAEDVAAEDNGAELMQELQEALKAKQELEGQVKSLQEQLSVCFTKESRYSEVLSRTKSELEQSKQVNSTLTDKVSSLEESLKQVNADNSVKDQKIRSLVEKLRVHRIKSTSLNEDIKHGASKVTELETKVSTLTESFNKERTELTAQNAKLTEELQDARKDSQILKSQTNATITKANQLVEKYKAIAKTSVDKYISLQAKRLSIREADIRSKLSESYSFNDIDHVCESLQQYKLKVNSLPFNVSSAVDSDSDLTTRKSVKMQIRESKETIVPVDPSTSYMVDDDIDDSLKNFIS